MKFKIKVVNISFDIEVEKEIVPPLADDCDDREVEETPPDLPISYEHEKKNIPDSWKW